MKVLKTRGGQPVPLEGPGVDRGRRPEGGEGQVLHGDRRGPLLALGPKVRRRRGNGIVTVL